MSMMRSSPAKKSHLQQMERHRTHQKLVTWSLQDQIRTLRIVQKMVLSEVVQLVVLKQNSVPKRSNKSKKAPHRKHHIPSDHTKTFFINSQGHFQCHQDPQLIYKSNDMGKLPGNREAPIYHEPGTVTCKTVDDLKKLYPNSFDRLGSLKGEYNIE